MNKGTGALLWILRVVLPCAVIYGAVLFYNYMISTEPEQERKPPVERRVFVETQEIKLQDKSVYIHATGKVVPVEEVSLQSRVSGEIIQLNSAFEPGEIIRKGEAIVSIDKADYLLAVKQAESALVEAEYNYKVELGYQQVC